MKPNVWYSVSALETNKTSTNSTPFQQLRKEADGTIAEIMRMNE